MMQIKTPRTKEEVIHFLLTYISMGTYDKKFVNNIHNSNRPLTTNQSELLEKIIVRYNKQFIKQGLSVHDLVKLPWKTEPVLSITEFTEAHISIVEDKIQLRSPYKKSFITELKNFHFPIQWDRNNRYWSIDFFESSLRQIIEITERHYSNIHYCEHITKIIDTLIPYEDIKYWDPTLVYHNNRYYIMAVNEHLYKAIEPLVQDINVQSMSRLISYGVNIEESAINKILETSVVPDPKIMRDLIESDDIQVDKTELINLIDTLLFLGCDMLLLTGTTSYDSKKKITNLIKEKLNDSNVVVHWVGSKNNKTNSIDKTCIYVSLINFGLRTMYRGIGIDKAINVADKTPIDLTKTTKEAYENV